VVVRLNKVFTSIEKLFERIDVQSGMRISFHHHLRNGDLVVKHVVGAMSRLGIKNIKLSATSLMPCHDFLIDFIRDGTIVSLETSGLRGSLGEFVSRGKGYLECRVIFRSHGGRARAISDGEAPVDIAFIAASSADIYGNATGVSGLNSFGSIGYGIWEAQNAKKVVIVTDNLVQGVLENISICQSQVDAILVVPSIGDSSKLKFGALVSKSDPITKVIARNVIAFLAKSGVDLDNASIQLGSGGISLETTKYLTDYLKESGKRIKFAIGGVTPELVQALEYGYIQSLLDVQSFDASVSKSLLKNSRHHEIDVNTYANPQNDSCAVNFLDIAILSALEIDVNWNVNVLTGSNGKFMGAIGGHQDVAEGSKLTIIVSPSIRERIPVVVKEVTTRVTDGKYVDVWINERGIVLKEEHNVYKKNLIDAGIPVLDMEEIYKEVEKLVGHAQRPRYKEKVVALVQDRTGCTKVKINEREVIK